jgi:hypothetical protein
VGLLWGNSCIAAVNTLSSAGEPQVSSEQWRSMVLSCKEAADAEFHAINADPTRTKTMLQAMEERAIQTLK